MKNIGVTVLTVAVTSDLANLEKFMESKTNDYRE